VNQEHRDKALAYWRLIGGEIAHEKFYDPDFEPSRTPIVTCSDLTADDLTQLSWKIPIITFAFAFLSLLPKAFMKIREKYFINNINNNNVKKE